MPYIASEWISNNSNYFILVQTNSVLIRLTFKKLLRQLRNVNTSSTIRSHSCLLRQLWKLWNAELGPTPSALPRSWGKLGPCWLPAGLGMTGTSRTHRYGCEIQQQLQQDVTRETSQWVGRVEDEVASLHAKRYSLCYLPTDHRIRESFWSEGTPRGHLVQPPRSEQGHR